MDFDPPPLEHCPACGQTIDPSDLGDVFFHAFGHDERSRAAGLGAVFLGEGDPAAWDFEEPKGHA